MGCRTIVSSKIHMITYVMSGSFNSPVLLLQRNIFVPKNYLLTYNHLENKFQKKKHIFKLVENCRTDEFRGLLVHF